MLNRYSTVLFVRSCYQYVYTYGCTFLVGIKSTAIANEICYHNAVLYSSEVINEVSKLSLVETTLLTWDVGTTIGRDYLLGWQYTAVLNTKNTPGFPRLVSYCTMGRDGMG